MANTGAPRLDIEISATTTNLVKGLREAREELKKFAKEAGKSGYKDILEAERLATQKARTEAVKFASDLKSSLAESLNNAKERTEQLKGATETYRQSVLGSVKAINDNKSALEAQRTATEAERTALAALKKEIANLALEKKKEQKVNEAAIGSYREAQQRLTALGRTIRDTAGGFSNTTPVVRAQIEEYRRLNEQLKSFDKNMGLNFRTIGDYKTALSGISPSIARFATIGGAAMATGAALQDGYQRIVKFDAGLKNVEKTTGLTRKEMQLLGDEFVNLSLKIQTTSATKLTEYATAAGQLGVKGSKNILNFSEALAKLETATDISGEAGSVEIARTLTLLDGGVQNVKKFGDEIVNLGNNFAATEKAILSNAESIAQGVGIYKIGRQEVLAYATATKAIGVEAELAGSAFNRTLSNFEASIRTGKGVKDILNLIGGSQAELSKRFKADASGVFMDFIAALNRIDKAGGSVNEQLDLLGINAVRDQKVIGSLASNGYDVLTRAMDTVKSSVGALDAEHKTKSESIVNQTGRMSIAWENFVLTIDKGEGLIGSSVKNISGFFANMLGALTELSKAADTFTGKVEFAAKFTPFMLAVRAIRYGNKKEDEAGRGYSAYMDNIINSKSKWLDLSSETLSITDQITREHANQAYQAKIAEQIEQDRLAAEKAKASEIGVTNKGIRQTISHLQTVKDLAQRVEFSSSLAESSDGLDKLLEKNRQKYKKYLDDLNLLEEKNKGKNVVDRESTKKVIAEQRIAIPQNQLLEEQAIRLKFAQETADKIKSIEDKAGITRITSRQKDLESNKNYWNEQERQAQNNADILLAIIEARRVSEQKINESWDLKANESVSKLYDKISKIEDKASSAGGKDAIGRELDTRLKQIEDFYKEIEKILKSLGVKDTSFLAPKMLKSFEKVYDDTKGKSTDEDFTKQFSNTLRRGLASTFDSLFSSLSTMSSKSLGIEKKYAELREKASISQIADLNKMESLERKINNGLTNMISKIGQSFGGIGGNMLTSALSSGIAAGVDEQGRSFVDLKNMFTGKNKAMGYGALGSLTGSIISGSTSQTSVAGQALGGLLSGAGTGLAIGAAIGGPLAPITAAIGGLVGAISGIFSANKARKQEKLMELQLIEQKKIAWATERQAALAYTSSIIGQQTNAGIVTSVDRNEYGELIATLAGSDIKLALQRTENKR